MELVRPSTDVFKKVHEAGNVETMPYLHTNPMVRWVFWKRIEKALAGMPERGTLAVDFGTGSGYSCPLWPNVSIA